MTATDNPTHRYARLSLAAVLITSLMTTIHHYYRMGFFTLVLGAVTIGLPIATILWFRTTRNAVALVAYGLVSGWVIVGFGLIDGLWKSTLKLFLGNFLLADYGQYFSWEPVGNFPFEATGILASISSLYALGYTLAFIRSAHADRRAAGMTSLGWVAAVIAVAAVSTGGYVVYAKGRNRGIPPEGGVIKIGVIVPQQGPGALLGSSFLKAVQMAKDDLKGTKYRYELVTADTGTNPVQTRAAIKRLIGVDEVRAIVGGISLPGQVIKPYATYAGIPHLCVCSVGSIGDGIFNFTNIPLPEDESTRWVEEARRRGIKSLALLSQDYPSIDGHVKALKEGLAAGGIRVTYANRFAGTTTEFAPIVEAARATQPDVYFVEATEPALDLLGARLKEAGIHNIASIVALSVSDNPTLFEGAWYTDSNLADRGFMTRFEAKYPDTRFAAHMMPYAYDSFDLAVRGFESGQDVVEYIRGETAYDGTAGHVNREPGSGNYRSRPAVWTIQDGRPRLLDQPAGPAAPATSGGAP